MFYGYGCASLRPERSLNLFDFLIAFVPELSGSLMALQY